MGTLFRLLTLLLCLSRAAPKCDKGTLQCDLSDARGPTPKICDFPNFYFLNAESLTCEKRSVPGCELPAFSLGNAPCFRCQPGFALDAAQHRCERVPEAKLIPGCFRYSLGADECRECEPGSWKFGSGCRAFSGTPVPNCEVYASDSACQACRPGFRLTGDGCAAFDPLEGCALHTDRVCRACAQGFLLDRSLGLLGTGEAPFTESLFELRSQARRWSPGDNLATPCVRGDVRNCAEYESAHKCRACLPNYFLTLEGACQRFPETPIPQCKEYASASECTRCRSGFFLSDSSTCVEAAPVEHCAATALDADKCVRCAPSHFLNASGSLCFARSRFPVERCIAYAVAEDRCQACDGKHSPTLDNLACLSDVENCAEQVPSVDIEDGPHTCRLCKEGFYAESPALCLAVSVDKCLRYEPNSNRCLECEEKFFVAGQAASECLLRSVDRCARYAQSSNKCEACLEGYYLQSEDRCASVSVDNCVKYRENENVCETCVDGHYLAGGGAQCLPRSIANCLEYDSSGSNTCVRCASLKRPSDDGTECQSLAHADRCLRSDGAQDVCLECQARFFLQNGLCTGELDPAKVDPHCAGNTGSSASFTCSRCKDQFALVKSAGFAVDFDFFETQHCLQIDANTGLCVQCKDLYEPSNGSCAAAPEPSALLCKRLSPNASAALASNEACEECLDPLTHFLAAGSCLPRQHPSAAVCGLADPAADAECLACPESQSRVVPLQTASVSWPKCTASGSLPGSWAEIADCLQYSASHTCERCAPEMTVSADGLACEAVETTVSFGVLVRLDERLDPVGPLKLDPPAIANCEAYDQVSPSQHGCSACEYEYTRVLPQPSLSRTEPYLFGSSADYNGFHIAAYNAFACEDQSLAFLLEDEQLHVEPENCAFGVLAEGLAGYACVSCLAPFLGDIVRVAFDSDSEAIDPPALAVGNCTAETADMESSFKLPGFEMRRSPHRLLWSHYMQFDSCSDASRVLVYMYTTSVSEPLVRFATGSEAGGAPLKQAYCLPPGQVPGAVADCAISVLRADFPGTFDPSADSLASTGCVACAAGHKATLNAEGSYVASCSPIPDCDMTEASWLGACSAPSHAAWEIERVSLLGAEIELIAFEKPVSAADALANCLVVDRAPLGPVCRLCESGFSVKNGLCAGVSAEDPLCETAALGRTSLKVGAHASSFQFVNFAFLRLNENNLEDENYSTALCGECAPGSVFLSTEQVSLGSWPGLESQRTCKVPAPGESGSPRAGDCALFDYRDPALCRRCRPGFILDATQQTCHSSDDHPHCLALETAAGALRCVRCSPDHRLNSLFLCAATNCLEWMAASSSECAVCAPGFVPVPDSKSFCVAETVPSASCGLFSPALGHCVRCKAEGALPFVFSRVALPPRVLKTECVPFAFDGPWASQYRLKYPYVLVDVLMDGSVDSVALESLATREQLQRTLAQPPADFPASLCLPAPPVDHCHADHYPMFLVCTRCSANFLLSAFNICSPGAVPHCASYAPDGVACAACAETHFLSGDASECNLRVHSTTCADRHASRDECLSCDRPDQWLHPIFKECRPSTSANCLEFDPSSDQCSVCLEHFWRKVDEETGLASCEAYSAQNCASKQPHKDECAACLAGFFQDTASDSLVCREYTAQRCSQFRVDRDECLACAEEHWLRSRDGARLCVPSDVEHCLEHYPGQNKCRTCSPSFFLSGAGCLPLTPISHCTRGSSSRDACEACENGFYLRRDLNECLPFPNGIPFCSEYVSTNVCVRCRAQHYLRDNACLPVTAAVPFCEDYNSPSNCTRCARGYVLDAFENACLAVSVHDCLEPASVATCAVCEAAFFPNAAGDCKASPVANCARADLADPSRCLECVASHALSDDATACVRVAALVPHCEEYRSDQSCRQCGSGYILSLDGHTCDPLASQAGANCSSAARVVQPSCDVCRLGFAKDAQGVCRPSGTTKCWVPHASGGRCLVCESGAFMDSQGKCIVDHVSFGARLRSLAWACGLLLWCGLG